MTTGRKRSSKPAKPAKKKAAKAPARPRKPAAKRAKAAAKRAKPATSHKKASTKRAATKPRRRAAPPAAGGTTREESVIELTEEDIEVVADVSAEEVEQRAKQFAYVLKPVEASPFARGSMIAPRPESLATAPWSARVQTPFAERAAGAGSCCQCEAPIPRAAWQVVVTDDGATIHPHCAFAWTQEHIGDDDETSTWMETLVEHLSDGDRAELLQALAPA